MKCLCSLAAARFSIVAAVNLPPFPPTDRHPAAAQQPGGAGRPPPTSFSRPGCIRILWMAKLSSRELLNRPASSYTRDLPSAAHK